MVPASLLAARWARPADVDRAEAAALTVVEGVRSQRIGPLRAGRADLGPAATRVLEATVSRQVAYDVRQLARVERLVAELRPSAILLTQEWIRLPWLNAARRARVPVFALQHGVLYRGHAGYPNRRHPALLMPHRTFVYGEFERRVLVDELAYEVQEVETSGSPRLDLDAASPQGERGEREAIRQLLGVRDGDRLVVVSTVHLRLLRRAHLAPMIERVLGGPLPKSTLSSSSILANRTRGSTAPSSATLPGRAGTNRRRCRS